MRHLILSLLITLGLALSPSVFANEPPATEAAAIVQMDLNQVSADELSHLPGLGQIKSAAIIAYREQHGPFQSVEELLQVKGIGPGILNKISPALTVSAN